LIIIIGSLSIINAVFVGLVFVGSRILVFVLVVILISVFVVVVTCKKIVLVRIVSF